ncbi:enoyl-CoA-hydratase DpgD [Streptomyces paradoxus]|uniref:enoyl-CoA hydratase n=1 Tax=Streptomyces paradoxus TaxID=66375 RepID=A0A7W9TK84_9ACTN|nr:enoyl-CoA-hydratase DpgD [Streptomyces paradoxus]MBB6081418.1 crotonobetainyl-CoA hydratase/dehydration protein DpgD [Streptomyces paradoxus]
MRTALFSFSATGVLPVMRKVTPASTGSPPLHSNSARKGDVSSVTRTEEPEVLYEKKGHVAHVTLNRPAVHNAMNLRTHEELAKVWDDVETDDEVRVAVLTGAGSGSFSVGQDLRERAELDRRGVPASTFGSRGQPGWPRLTERFTLTKPVIARVNGYALGGGFELALACDLIIASDHSVFALPEATLGLVPGAGGAFRLARQIPLKIAMGYLLTGRRMSADDALRHGLVNEVVPEKDLDATVTAWTDAVLRSAPLAVRAIKEAVMRSLDLPLPEAFVTPYAWEQRRRHSVDAREGPRAFAEGREPVWRAR